MHIHKNKKAELSMTHKKEIAGMPRIIIHLLWNGASISDLLSILEQHNDLHSNNYSFRTAGTREGGPSQNTGT